MKTSSGLPGRWIWTALVLALALLALIRVFSEAPEPHGVLRGTLVANARWIVGLAVALAVALLTLVVMSHSEPGSRRDLDRTFLMLALSWVISSAAVAATSLTNGDHSAVFFRNLAYQLSVAASLNFLRSTIAHRTPVERMLVLLQWFVASGFLVFGYYAQSDPIWPVVAWRVTNVVAYTAVFLVLCRSLLSDSIYPPWLLLGACLMGLGLGLSDMANADGSAVVVSTIHNVYSAYLMMIWLLLTNRIGRLYTVRVQPRERSENSILGDEFAHTDLDELHTPYEAAPSVPDAMVTRRRIAQELHDGVGSQLVSLLASLDRKVPQQRAMAESLEQCLLDVKILVDDIDSAHECVLDTLARLRYRVQGSLDRLGIRLDWDLRDDGPLHDVCDERSRQVLRIAQEALANVMRHSRASNVSVSCRYAHEAGAMILDITDDGKGFDVRRPLGLAGKGLQGMHRRADSIQANLMIESAPGAGTTIRLFLPLNVGASAEQRLRVSSLPAN